MANYGRHSGMSELEREIELEMDEELESLEAGEDLETPDYEDDDRESGDAWELEEEAGDEEAGDEEAGPEEEVDDTGEAQFEGDERNQEYVERFLEIASRQFESEAEVDQAMNEVLDGMSREYLFGSIWKKAKRLGSTLAKNPAVQALVRKGLSVASQQFPALKAALALAQGNLQGALRNAAVAAIPGGPQALGALKALGFSEADDPQANREAWDNYVQMSREAFEHLANNVTSSADEPLEASRIATNAYKYAMQRAQNRTNARRRARGVVVSTGGRRHRGKVVRYHLRPGQKIIITGAANLIVKGI